MEDKYAHLNKAHYAGIHILADMHGCDASILQDSEFLRNVMIQAAQESKATVLDSSSFHTFGDGGGVTGLIVLAESHISIHTYPEVNLAMIDVMTCGDCNPQFAIDYIAKKLHPNNATISKHYRGLVKS